MKGGVRGMKDELLYMIYLGDAKQSGVKEPLIFEEWLRVRETK